MDLETLGWNASLEKHWKKGGGTGLYPARICRQDRKEYTLISGHGLEKAHSRGRLHTQGNDPSLLPVVGDWVAASHVDISTTARQSIITAVLPRMSYISRKAPGPKPREQVLAANIDFIFIVAGLDQPLNIRRIERFITQARVTGAMPVVILNKSDLSSDIAAAVQSVTPATGGSPVHAVSALTEEGLTPLRPYMSRGKTVTLLGVSGTGKSTIVNRMTGTGRMKVRETHDATGEGRHTTTHRELILLPSGGMIIDMPGIRELQLWADEQHIRDAFSDIENIAGSCRFRDCRHTREPGCAVQQALRQGSIQEHRLLSYQKLKQELRTLEESRKRRQWKKPR
ncbi:ribosome small subunit-dependent GTPase A [bacterium]|nr:ribosome small subunit-dependent GTPase A [bacterium]